METVNIPISSISNDHSYYAESSGYPLDNCIGQYSNGVKYAGVNWTLGADTETYLYLCFDTSLIPQNVAIKSVTANVKLYGSSTGQSRSSERTVLLYSGTSPKGEATDFILLSGTVWQITEGGLWSRQELSDLRIKIHIIRNSSNTTSSTYVYVMGADVTIQYDEAALVNLTVQDNGYNVSPTGINQYSEGDNVEIAISENPLPTVLLDGVEITDRFTSALRSGSFEGNAIDYSSTGLSYGSNYVAGAVGLSAENPSYNNNNWYGSNIATVDSQYALYTFNVSSIPLDATNIKVSCKVAGKAESTTYTHLSGGRYSVWGLCSNGTSKGELIHATSTSISVLEFTDTGSWTRAELNGLLLRHYVGYYGGSTNGITLTISYLTGGGSDTYVYNLFMDSDHTIVVGGSVQELQTLYVKINGLFRLVSKVLLKLNGSWSECTDLKTLFESATNNSWSGYFINL